MSSPNTEEIKTAWCALTHSPEAFERWLEQVKADAWDEGWRDGIVVPYSLGNPYRKKKEQS